MKPMPQMHMADCTWCLLLSPPDSKRSLHSHLLINELRHHADRELDPSWINFFNAIKFSGQFLRVSPTTITDAWYFTIVHLKLGERREEISSIP